MSYETSVREDIFCIRAFEVITLADVFGLGQVLRGLEADSAVVQHRLLDLTEATGIEPRQPALEIFARERTEALLKNPIRTAVVAPNNLHFGVARMFQSMNRNPQVSMRVFRRREEAWTWVTTGGTEEAED